MPWCGIKAKNVKEKYELIEQKKLITSVEEICAGLPKCFEKYISYCRNLKFQETPNYELLRQVFRETAKQYEIAFDNHYDWMPKGNK